MNCSVATLHGKGIIVQCLLFYLPPALLALRYSLADAAVFSTDFVLWHWLHRVQHFAKVIVVKAHTLNLTGKLDERRADGTRKCVVLNRGDGLSQREKSRR